MKKKILIGVILIVLLIPIPRHLKDGGTVEYTALIYKISKVNKIVQDTSHEKGIIIEILGKCIYDSVTVESNYNKEGKEDNNMKKVTNINVTINDKLYQAQIEDNETAQLFASRLPQKFIMHELNGNEKYVYMNDALPTNASKPETIETGDIMLYGDDCLVIFYKSFKTSYSYTKIGHINDLISLNDDQIIAEFETK